MSTQADDARSTATPFEGRGRTIALCVILLGFFMDVLDSTIVNVAIPSIQDGLEASYSSIQWIVAGYSLMFALFLITGGRLGDIFGYKTMFVLGIVGFTLASALSGMSVTTGHLIAARLFQGFTAAIMVPQVLSTIQVLFPTLKERRSVSIFYGSLAGIATVIGPVLGAVLINGDFWELGWRAIFLVNIPVGIVAIVLAIIYLPSARSPDRVRIDFLGVGLVVLAMFMLMFPLIEGRQLDWPLWAFVCMAASLPVFALFYASQVWIERRGGSPVVVPDLLRQRSFSAGITLLGSFYAIIYGFFLVFIIFLQIGLKYPILKAGLTGIPLPLGVAAAAALSSIFLVPRFGRAVITVGPIIVASGLVLMIATLHRFGGDVTPWELIPPQLIAGIGMGFVVSPIYPFALAEVRLKDAGSASGVVNAVAQIGGAVGVAVIGAVFFSLLASRADSSVTSVRPQVEAGLAGTGLPADAQSAILASFEACFRDGARAKDPAERPESCKDIRGLVGGIEDPDRLQAVADVLKDAGGLASVRNFIVAVERTLVWLIAALCAVFFITFLLPPQPRSREELEAAGMAI